MSGKEQVFVDAPASAALQLVNPSSSFSDIVPRLSYSLAHVLGLILDITARGPRAGLDVSPRIYRPHFLNVLRQEHVWPASINPLGVCVDRSDDLVKSLLSYLSEAIGLWPCLEPNQGLLIL